MTLTRTSPNKRFPFKWFENYLSNRTQFVKSGNTKSNCETITCGIPQGSTLGPLLFLLYINDLPNCSNKLSFRIFADDTNMFYTSANLQHLESVMNEELKLVFNYFTSNKLSINLTKTKYMVISSSRIGGHIHKDKFERQSQIKYLGVFIVGKYFKIHSVQYQINEKYSCFRVRTSL